MNRNELEVIARKLKDSIDILLDNTVRCPNGELAWPATIAPHITLYDHILWRLHHDMPPPVLDDHLCVLELRLTSVEVWMSLQKEKCPVWDAFMEAFKSFHDAYQAAHKENGVSS